MRSLINSFHPHGSVWRVWLFALAWLSPACSGLYGQPVASAPHDPAATVITTFDEYWRAGLRARVRPIRAEVVVTYYDPAWGHIWGEIEGKPGYLRCTGPLPIRSFDRVLIEGTVVPDRGIDPDTSTLTVLHRDVVLAPTDATGKLADFDRWRSRLVTCEVLVGEEEFSDGNHLVIQGVAEGHRVHVYHWMVPPKLLSLQQGETVRVTGVYNANRNADTGLLEIDLWAARTDAIAPLLPSVPPPKDAAALMAQGASGPPIRTADDFWLEGQRAVQRPIDMEVAVTYYDPTWGTLWGEIDGKPGYLRCGARLPIMSRDRIRIQGTVVPEQGLMPDAIAITTIAKDYQPRVIAIDEHRTDLDALNSTVVSCDIQIFSEAITADQHLMIEGILGKTPVHVYHWAEQPRSLGVQRGAVVRATGLLNLHRDPAGAVTGLDLWVAQSTDLQVVAGEVVTETSDPSQIVITSIPEFYRDDMRDRERPIDIRLAIQYYDPGWGLLWGLINGSPGYIPCRPGVTLPMRSGDRVRLQGTVIRSRGLEPERVKVTIEEPDAPMPVLDATHGVADISKFTAQIVTTEVLIDRVFTSDSNHVGFDGVADGVRVHALHYTESGQWVPPAEGDIVRVRGLYNPKRDPRTNGVEVDLWIARREHVETIGNLATDNRFDIPLTPVGDLLSWDGGSPPPARVVGIVREFIAGREVVIRDDAGQATVQTVQMAPLKIGDIVEAWGVPMTLGADCVLQRGLVRPARTKTANELLLRLGTPRDLRLADEVLALQPEEARAGRAVNLRGIIAWTSRSGRTMILRDGTAGVRLDASTYTGEMPKRGYVLRAFGTAIPGPFASGVKVERFDFQSTGMIPAAKSVTLDQVRSGLEEGQIVELRGLVRDVSSENGQARLRLSTSTGEFTAVLESGGNPTHFIGSMAAVTGICQAVANAQRQLTGIEVRAETEESVRVLQEAPSDPFNVPLRAIGALRQFDPKSTMQYWARVRGVVTHQIPGRLVMVQDGAQGLMILTGQHDPLTPGDVIEATGLPGYESERVVLRDSVFRHITREAEPLPVELHDPGRVIESYESRLVRLRGVLLNVADDGGATQLALQAQDRVFNAVLWRAAGTALEPWLPGSTLELTGVYEVLRDERRQPDNIRLQLRSARDVTVIERPSWWTPQRGALVVAGLVACVAAGLIWAAALRRRVRQQTHQIRIQLEKETKLEARHRDVFEKASDFIFTTDREGRFVTFNPAGERITGYSRDEALQLNLRDLLDTSERADELRAALQSPRDQSLTFQGRLKSRDGRELWAEASVRFIFEHDSFTGMLGVIRDISERKQVEDELKRARDAAEANTQARSAFLANMSHEIRTPMNGVIGMSNLLLDTALQDEQREFATTIRNSAESLLTVLNDILDFSKIEAGRLHFDTIEFDLIENLEDTVDLMKERVVARKLELVSILPPELPARLCGDPGRLRQVMINLIGNAAKFTETGEIVVRADRQFETPEHVGLRISVTDTGVGIAPDVLPRLFQPFVQADVSTTRRFGGTGLGLAISKQIVSLMGGQIGVESALGQGSTFWFTLTLKKPSALAATTRQTSGPTRRALVVGDHANRRAAVVAAAAACGVVAEEASSIADAAVRLARNATGSPRIDCVFLDAALAGGEGLDEMPALHRAFRGVLAPAVILVRPFDSRYLPGQLAAAGIAGVMKRPVRRRELSAALESTAATPPTGISPAAVAPPASASEPARTTDSTLRILVAEDNIVNQRLIVLQLRKLGYSCAVANNGVEVLAALERESYDVVLMDCQMPELDGYEATRRIRQNAHTARVRIVAMTAHAMQGDREKCIAAGMDDYVSKPIRLEALEAALRAAVVAGAPG